MLVKTKLQGQFSSLHIAASSPLLWPAKAQQAFLQQALSPVRRAHASYSSTARVAAGADHASALVLSEYEQEYYREAIPLHVCGTCRASACFVIGQGMTINTLQVNTRDVDLNSAAPSDFYQLLGLEYDADGSAIRFAYRTLQRIAHPDIAGEAAQAALLQGSD